MNIQVRDLPEQAASVQTKTAIADCDIHPARATRTELYPFLAKRWHDHLETYDQHPYQGMMEDAMGRRRGYCIPSSLI